MKSFTLRVIGISFVLCLCSIFAKAQNIDTILLTVDLSLKNIKFTKGYVTFGVYATNQESFTVDWGDGNVNTYLGKGNSSGFVGIGNEHEYDTLCGIYTITIVGSPTCYFSRLQTSAGSANGITEVEVGKWNNHLDALICPTGDSINRINVFNNGVPIDIVKYGGAVFEYSRLLLSKIDSIRMITKIAPVSNPGGMPQTLKHQYITQGDTIDFSSEAIIRGTPTLFEVLQFDAITPLSAYQIPWLYHYGWIQPANPNSYTQTNGVFVFKDTGEYLIKMTNPKVLVCSPYNANDIAQVHQRVTVVANKADLPYFKDSICAGGVYNQNGFYETQAGTYTRAVPNIRGCDSIITLKLTVLPPDTLTIYDTICQGQSLLFAGRSCTQAGTYTDTLQNVFGCDSIVTLQLTVNDLFNVSLGNDTAICWLDSLKLDAKHPQANSYKWQDGSTGATYTVYYDGQYWVIVTNPCNDASDTINVSYLKDKIDIDLGGDTVFCEEALIYKELDVTSPFASYLWQDGSTSPVYIIEQAGIYSVTVSNACMSVSKSISVKTEDCSEFEVWRPNTFTPNTDGLNDGWRPVSFNIAKEGYILSLYDRWGNRIFHTTDPDIAWDGTIYGKPAENNTSYSYILVVRDLKGKEHKYTGSVTILR